MGVYMIMENIIKKYYYEKEIDEQGIYAILNIDDNKIYIGQAQSMKNRGESHRDDLEKGIDNHSMNRDYKKGKRLINFALMYKKDVLDCDEEIDLNYYESLFCYIAQQFFTEDNSLYNANKNETIIRDGKAYLKDMYNKEDNIIDKDIERWTEKFVKAFESRFLCKPNELIDKNKEEKEKLFNDYLKNENDKIRHGVFYHKNLDLIDDISLFDVPVKKMIFNKIGEYLDQDIFEILKEKQEDINSCGYCVWSLDKLNTETVRKFCDGEDVYVIMRYTDNPSAIRKYNDTKSIVTADHFLKKDVLKMKKTGFNPELELGISEENDYAFPESLENYETCIKSKVSYARAFVIERFYRLRENFDEKTFLKYYNAYNKGNECKDALLSIKGQNDTSCIQIKDINYREKMLADVCNKSANNGQSNYILAKLKRPYFVKLRKDEGEFKGRKRNINK